MLDESAITVSNVAKDFILPHSRKHSVKSIVTGLFRSDDKTAETQHALQNINVTIKKGEFFGILGRNGSGKSTLLKILAGIYQPTAGSVEISGKLVSFIELGVGFNPELTGRENVFLNGAMLGFSQRQVDAMYTDIVEFAELERFMDQKLKNYSSCMQVRLAFSMATRAEADILLVDEVLAVGDADFQRKCYDYFKSLKKNKKTVVFVTHDMGAVREYCDRAVLIQDGTVAHMGGADTIADEYLKLFNTNSEEAANDEVKEENSRRWGNGQVKIKELKARLTDKKIELTVKLRADKHGADSFVFGYRFINSEGVMIMGGNNHNATNPLKLSLNPGEEKNLTFTIDNILGSGSFAIGSTIRLSDRVTICDNWDDITTIKVTKAESYYSIIAPAVIGQKD